MKPNMDVAIPAFRPVLIGARVIAVEHQSYGFDPGR